MQSIVRMLLEKSYWRMLLRKGTWSEAALSVRRAHKDRRARTHLLAIGVMAFSPILLLAYALWLVGTGTIILVPFVVPVIWLIRRGHQRDDLAQLRISPPSEQAWRGLSELERNAIRSHLARMAVIFAVFLDRAGSEAFLKENTIPSGHEVVSRRQHLELLKAIGAWENLSPADRDAMIAADGNWDWSLINQVALCVEPLRALRWILRLDFYLPLVGHQLRVDYKMAKEIVSDPNRVLLGSSLASPAMLENGRNAARSYLMRCLAELISRGLVEAQNEEISQWATKAAASMRGNQNEDLLLDKSLVSEATEQQIRWAASLAGRRADFLKWAIDVVEGSTPITSELAIIS
jgi:hypothetical protein